MSYAQIPQAEESAVPLVAIPISAPAPVSVPPGQWSCHACTLLNPVSTQRCTVCNTERRQDVAASVPSSVPLVGIPVAQGAQQVQMAVPVAVPYPSPAAANVQVQMPGSPDQDFVAVTPAAPTLEQFEHTAQNRLVAFSCSKYFREAWHFFKHNWGRLVLFTLVSLLVQVLVSSLLMAAVQALHPAPLVDYLLQLAFVALPSNVLVAFPMLAGFYIAVFNALRSNAYLVWADFFAVYRDAHYFARLAALAVVYTLLFNLGLWLFIVPGVWFAVVTCLAIPMHKEHGLAIMHSFKLSNTVVRRYCCSVFGFLIIAALLIFLGALCLGVGLLVAMPVAQLASVYMYHNLVVINGVTVLVRRNAPSLLPGNSAIYHTAMDAL